jgi:hypothetical protein
MGHRSNDTIEYYKTGIQDIDTQAIIRGRPQRFELIEESISMLDNRDLAAPQPPGARLIDIASRLPQVNRVDFGAHEESDSSNDSASDDSLDHDIEEKEENALPTVLSVTRLTAAQQYYARRQSRNKAYQKQRIEYFQGRDDYLVTPSLCSNLAESSSEPADQSRLPSRYLKSLLKYQPSRQQIINLLYPGGAPHVKHGLSLASILEPLSEMASPKTKRYMYNSVKVREDNCCAVCKKSLDT